MLQQPMIIKSNAQHAAIIHVTVPREEIRTVMGPSFQELMTALKAQGIQPAGPWFSHHLRMDPKVFDIEIGVPVEKPIRAAGRVRPGELPAATVARTIYRGAYEGLPTAWGEFETWIKNEGLKMAPNLWEVYAKGPESDPDPDMWETELNRPVATG
ncbi:MAG TPA: GyrI-like domain-containing protein [Candidatus Krumholzibacteria bacterium]